MYIYIYIYIFSSVNLGEAVCAMHLCPGINIQLTHQLYLSERKSWHRETRETVPAFVRRYAPRVCQSGLNTDNDSSVTVEPHQVDSSWVEPRGRPGRRLREWFESRPYTGGVVPSTYNYRKLASFCRAVSCPPFLILRLTHAALLSLVADKIGWSLCEVGRSFSENFDSERVPDPCPKDFRVLDKFEKQKPKQHSSKLGHKTFKMFLDIKHLRFLHVKNMCIVWEVLAIRF